MTETTALGAAIAAGAADGIGLWDTKTKKESSDVSIFQPKLDESGMSYDCTFSSGCDVGHSVLLLAWFYTIGIHTCLYNRYSFC